MHSVCIYIYIYTHTCTYISPDNLQIFLVFQSWLQICCGKTCVFHFFSRLQIFLSLCFFFKYMLFLWSISDNPISPSLLLLLDFLTVLSPVWLVIIPRTLTVVFRKLSVGIIWDPGSLERILVSCVGYRWILLFLMSDLSVIHGEENTGAPLICNLLWPGSPYRLCSSRSCETAWLPRPKSVFNKTCVNILSYVRLLYLIVVQHT